MFNQPIQKLAGIALTPGLGQSGQVIEIKHPAPGQEFTRAKTCSTFYKPLVTQSQNLIGLTLLASDLRQEPSGRQLRAERMECRETAQYFLIRTGNKYFSSQG